MKTGKMSVFQFGEQLLKLNDLDPVYVVLWNAQLDPIKLRRWLVAYWCFYHVGTSSWIVDQLDYWKAMLTAAKSKEWPRSRERRHFRGENARKSVYYLRSRGSVALFDDLERTDGSISEIMKAVQRWVGFGPWIAFKVADMVERMGLIKVHFDNGAMFLFDSPKEGAKMMAEIEGGPIDNYQSWAVKTLIEHFKLRMAPPRYERRFNAQEAETVLCKWKSYMGGHYHLGEDVESVYKGLELFSTCSTSKQLIEGGKEGKLWD